MKIKYFFVFVVGLIMWLFLFSFVHYKAKGVVQYIANNITGSNANESCCYYEWDISLQIFTYSLYAAIFFIVTISLIFIWKKYKSLLFIKNIVVVIFIMIFPTHTFWGVASECGGFGGCSNGNYFNIVTPVIMSINPIAMIISGFFAYKLATIYMKNA